MPARKGVLLKIDIHTASKIHTPSKENTFPKSSIPKICCHQIPSSIAKVSSHFEKVPSPIPRKKL
ncbi:hypothetical protein PN398_12580 [Romboutsia sp. 1001216sp1]|uniref:hypothetical protein n=1 Tax=unclassified Romboutsia TaxID=2626894 RepID=UPI00189F2840|nr:MULTISPECIES: hypothetical protein [unclassified Romboutsia]MDB8791561.1 hypothetical protein [Romboutsia sp. 1001216sp1]MDB8801044.1 hypothetical protein [Romboutsia sp. 1001216sp1]MDB8812443.1 hypothetical protein [Romboutsia sp. 1001216sp1]